jgi:hypothetical protein
LVSEDQGTEGELLCVCNPPLKEKIDGAAEIAESEEQAFEEQAHERHVVCEDEIVDDVETNVKETQTDNTAEHIIINIENVDEVVDEVVDDLVDEVVDGDEEDGTSSPEEKEIAFGDFLDKIE